ncbi:hypothetical protein [uncultured Enterovirga sp.]|uniref:hypothetical protein n=1 Tax=uncultured Enterovirga sp. TaxID=2026352 RepID=UPI0035C99AA1
MVTGEIVPAKDAAEAVVKALQAMARFGGAAVLRFSPTGDHAALHSTYGEVPKSFADRYRQR